MKEIWINLELYFKRYDFYNFLGFFWIFFLIFLISFLSKNVKNKYKKNVKSERGPRGCDMARKATWQSHADPRSAPTWRGYIYIYILYLLYKYKRGLWPALYGEGHTLRNRRVL